MYILVVITIDISSKLTKKELTEQKEQYVSCCFRHVWKWCIHYSLVYHAFLELHKLKAFSFVREYGITYAFAVLTFGSSILQNASSFDRCFFFFFILVLSDFIIITSLFYGIPLTTLVSIMFSLIIEKIVKTINITVNMWKSSFGSQLYSSWMEQFLSSGFSKCWNFLPLKWFLNSSVLFKVVLSSCFIPKIFHRGLEIIGNHAWTLSQKILSQHPKLLSPGAKV